MAEIIPDAEIATENIASPETPLSLEIPPLIETLKQGLNNSDPKVRIAAAGALCESGNPCVSQYLRESLASEGNTTVRIALYAGLERLENILETDLNELLEIAQTPYLGSGNTKDPEMLVEIILSIPNPSRVKSTLQSIAENPDITHSLRVYALDALAAISAPKDAAATNTLFHTLLQSDSFSLRCKALMGLANTGNHEEAAEYIMNYLDLDRQNLPDEFFIPVLETAPLCGDKMVSILQKALTHKSIKIREYAIHCLALFGTADDMKIIIRVLGDETSRINSAVIIEELMCSAENTVAATMQILGDDSSDATLVQGAAQAAIALEIKQTLPLLIAIGGSQNPPAEAIRALGELGGVNDALPCLQQIVEKNKDNPQLLAHALNAIKAILSRITP